MLMQNFGMTNKEHYGLLWYFLEWSIGELARSGSQATHTREAVSLPVFSLDPDLLFDCSRVLEYAKIRTDCFAV